jgi:hypothetical protein
VGGVRPLRASKAMTWNVCGVRSSACLRRPHLVRHRHGRFHPDHRGSRQCCLRAESAGDKPVTASARSLPAFTYSIEEPRA